MVKRAVHQAEIQEKCWVHRTYQELLTFAWKQYCMMVGNLPKLNFSISLTLEYGENTAAPLIVCFLFLLDSFIQLFQSTFALMNLSMQQHWSNLYQVMCYRWISLYSKDCSRCFQYVNGAVSESLFPIVRMEYLEALEEHIPSAFSSASASAASSPHLLSQS